MSTFRLDYSIAELSLRHTFTISRESKQAVRNVFVGLQSGGITGIGEAAPNRRYGESTEKVIQFLDNLPTNFWDDVDSPARLENKLGKLRRPIKSAKAALEMAWLDWWGKSQGKPLWQLWNAPSNRGPVTSFTIGLDKPDVMQQKVEDAEAYPILKVKLGTEHDLQIIEANREVTTKPLRIDANEGWQSLKEAKRNISFLADQNVELVEQPMPDDRITEMSKLKAWSPVPLCADESFEGDEDLVQIANTFHAVNIKLMKTGSLVKAWQMIDRIRQAGLQIMIGCMIESSLANTAGALLSLWADYADLDGHLLILNDPFNGLKLNENKQIILGTMPGLGVERKQGS